MREHFDALRRDPILLALWIVLIMTALLWLAPVVFIIFTSLKSSARYYKLGCILDSTFTGI